MVAPILIPGGKHADALPGQLRCGSSVFCSAARDRVSSGRREFQRSLTVPGLGALPFMILWPPCNCSGTLRRGLPTACDPADGRISGASPPLPSSWQADLQAPRQGRVIFLRRSWARRTSWGALSWWTPIGPTVWFEPRSIWARTGFLFTPCVGENRPRNLCLQACSYRMPRKRFQGRRRP